MLCQKRVPSYTHAATATVYCLLIHFDKEASNRFIATGMWLVKDEYVLVVPGQLLTV